MVAGPRAPVAAPQMWVAVGPDMRPLPLLHAPSTDADGPAGTAAHSRAAEAVRLCPSCLQSCCRIHQLRSACCNTAVLENMRQHIQVHQCTA